MLHGYSSQSGTRSALMFATAVCVTGLFAVSSSAALLTHDDFDYTLATTVNGSSSFGNHPGEWKNNWSAADAHPGSAATVVAGLTYGSLDTSGNAISLNVNGAKRTAADATGLAFNYDGTKAGTGHVAWVSFLIRKDSTDAGNGGLNLPNTYAYQAGQTIGIVNGTFRSMGVDSGVAPALNQTHFLVTKFDWSGGAKPLVTFFVDPAPGSVAPLDASGTSGLTPNNFGWGGGSAATSFDGNADLAFRGNGYSVDEVRFGNTYADVAPIPEPAGLALIGLAVPALLRRRK